MIDDITFDHLIMKPEEVDMVIYHGNCNDGFGSAFSAYMFFSENFPNKKIDYYPASLYQKPPDVKGRNVVICDFSYKYNVLQQMIGEANKLIILDHHKSAMEDLKNIPDCNKVFRMDHSGAYITWRYFHFDKPIPKLILYIEDRDIWTKKMYMTDEFSTYLFTVEHSFYEYKKLLDETNMTNAITLEGTAMMKQNTHNINSAIEFGAPKFIQIGDKYYFVAYLNSSVLKSDVGNKIFSKFINTNFSAIYSIDDWTNSTMFSLRSLDDRTDVSQIATKFDGGGHKCASGLRLSYVTSTLPGTTFDNGRLYNEIDKLYFDDIEIDPTNKYKVVYLNSSHCKSELAKYLLQQRNETMQEAVSIYKNKTNNLITEHVYISAIWHYDGLENKTLYAIHLHPKMDVDKRNFIEKNLESEIKNDMIFVTYDGFQKNISFMKKPLMTVQ